MQPQTKLEDDVYDYGEDEIVVNAKNDRLTDLEYQERYERAKKHVDEIRDFYIHLAVYVCINAFLYVFDLIQGGGLDFAYYVSFFWGIGVVIHFGSVFGEGIFLGRDWEERKIRELMGEDEKPKRRG